MIDSMFKELQGNKGRKIGEARGSAGMGFHHLPARLAFIFTAARTLALPKVASPPRSPRSSGMERAAVAAFTCPGLPGHRLAFTPACRGGRIIFPH